MTLHPALRRPALAATSLAVAGLLAACGGGDDNAGLSAEVAQGYASDASMMPVSSTSNLDSAATELELGVANPNPTAASTTDMQAQGLSSISGTANCSGGGTVAWTISGNTSQTGDGQFDAGEIYTVTYTGCQTLADPGLTLDGTLQLAVTAWSAASSDVTLTATALKATTARGTYTVNGTTRRTRTVVDLVGGGRQVTARLQKSGTAAVSLATALGTRNASYTLQNLDWTIVRTFNAAGALTGRSHTGSLDLAASTPRRPNATLHIESIGALTLDSSDGLVAAGHFKVVTLNNTIDCTWGGGSITLTLDRGNDGQIDRTWTLTRTTYDGEAG